jgi:hypothetical protein
MNCGISLPLVPALIVESWRLLSPFLSPRDCGDESEQERGDLTDSIGGCYIAFMTTKISTKKRGTATTKTDKRMVPSADALLAWRKKYGQRLVGWDDVEAIRQGRNRR